MGIHESELVDPASVSETLKCPVCMEVFDDPVFCGGRPCQHVFCRDCVERALEMTEQCPVCRAPMASEDLHPHQVINSLLDEVSVLCERACGWTGRRDARGTHVATCPIVLMEQAQQKLEAQSEKFASADVQLAERDAQIVTLEALVAEKDQHILSTGQELVKCQLQISQLEGELVRSETQLKDVMRQLEDRTVQLQMLRQGRDTPHSIHGPPPTPLHGDSLARATMLAAAVALEPGAQDLVQEGSWLDPEGFSQMNLTVHNEESTAYEPLDADGTAGEPWL